MSKKKVNIAIIGATGYVGLDLVYLLSKHPKANIRYLCAQKNTGKSIQLFDKRIKKKLPKISKLSSILWRNIDLVFLSLPNGEAHRIIKDKVKYKNIKFIDLSADFRINDPIKYKEWYKINHAAKMFTYNIRLRYSRDRTQRSWSSTRKSMTTTVHGKARFNPIARLTSLTSLLTSADLLAPFPNPAEQIPRL